MIKKILESKYILGALNALGIFCLMSFIITACFSNFFDGFTSNCAEMHVFPKQCETFLWEYVLELYLYLFSIDLSFPIHFAVVGIAVSLFDLSFKPAFFYTIFLTVFILEILLTARLYKKIWDKFLNAKKHEKIQERYLKKALFLILLSPILFIWVTKFL